MWKAVRLDLALDIHIYENFHYVQIKFTGHNCSP